MLCPGSEAGIAEVSVHPVHLLDSMERALPAALIPFCSYQANMSLLGNPGEQFPFVACDKFQPYLLEGQLCYSLDLMDIKSVVSRKGKGKGMLLVLDPTSISYNDDDDYQEDSAITNESHLARIYLHTMTTFSSSKNGSYALSVLKKITGTASFLQMPEKGCQVESYEECNTRKYLDRVAEVCSCVPWTLSSASGQVCLFIVEAKVVHFYVNPPRESLSARPASPPASPQSPPPVTSARWPEIHSSCMKANPKVACSGLHADVAQQLEDKTTARLAKIIKGSNATVII